MVPERLLASRTVNALDAFRRMLSRASAELIFIIVGLAMMIFSNTIYKFSFIFCKNREKSGLFV
jgi:hypothetical protein